MIPTAGQHGCREYNVSFLSTEFFILLSMKLDVNPLGKTCDLIRRFFELIFETFEDLEKFESLEISRSLINLKKSLRFKDRISKTFENLKDVLSSRIS